jgi:Na+-driven multidrug efflux pump
MVEKSRLIAEPIPKLIRDITVPASVGFLFNTLYNAVDTFFSGLISTQALASLSLFFPVFFIIIAVWIGIYRQIAAPIAIFWVLTRVFPFGLLEIWWGIFAITRSAAAITLFYARRIVGRKIDLQEQTTGYGHDL